MGKMIRGYSENQHGGPCLVAIDGKILGLPPIDEQQEHRHSPAGFAWGYYGSGPAELARALLLTCCPAYQEVARQPICYQLFKADVIAKLPADGFKLRVEDVVGWMLDFVASPVGQATLRELKEHRRRAESAG